jgi:hypothetical protein
VFTNVYEVDRMARERSQSRLDEAENERRAHLARQAERASQAEAECNDAEANSKPASTFPSKLLQLIRG